MKQNIGWVCYLGLWISLLTVAMPSAIADSWQTRLVSKGTLGDVSDAQSFSQALNSLDGRYSVYSSRSSFLVDGQVDTNGLDDVFLYDRVANTTTLISRALGAATATANNASNPTAISSDGNWVLYRSNATNVVSGVSDGNGQTDVFLFDRASGTSTLVSRALGAATTTANNSSFPIAISSDGNWVLY